MIQLVIKRAYRALLARRSGSAGTPPGAANGEHA
jgi:hypothetical protein